MPVTAARRYHDPDEEAKLLLGFCGCRHRWCGLHLLFPPACPQGTVDGSQPLHARCRFRLLGHPALTLTLQPKGRTPGRIPLCASSRRQDNQSTTKGVRRRLHRDRLRHLTRSRCAGRTKSGHAGQWLRHDRRRQDHPAAEHHPARPGPRDRTKATSQDPANYYRRQGRARVPRRQVAAPDRRRR